MKGVGMGPHSQQAGPKIPSECTKKVAISSRLCSLVCGENYHARGPSMCAYTVYCAGIFKQSMGPRNRVGIGLSYRPARLHSLAKLVP